MNERIKELAQEFATFTETMTGVETEYIFDDEDLERFAELVRQDERDAWRNAAIRLGEELSSVSPDFYYDMTAKQWLDWALDQQPRGKNSLPAPPQAEKNKFNPDWDQQAVLVERIRELEAQQALDKKADNARELGLSYEPEPVAWICYGFGKQKHDMDFWQDDIDALPVGTMLYTAPPQTEKQEIVAFRHWIKVDDEMFPQLTLMPRTDKDEPLYTAPPRKEWVGLTELEVKHYNNRLSGSNVAQEIESKLRERNT